MYRYKISCDVLPLRVVLQISSMWTVDYRTDMAIKPDVQKERCTDNTYADALRVRWNRRKWRTSKKCRYCISAQALVAVCRFHSRRH